MSSEPGGLANAEPHVAMARRSSHYFACSRFALPCAGMPSIGRGVAMHLPALRPACLMFMLCLALHCPCRVFRCCADALRAAPHEYRTRSVFNFPLGFAILLRAFATCLNSSRCACMFAGGAFDVVLSIPCGRPVWSFMCLSCPCPADPVFFPCRSVSLLYVCRVCNMSFPYCPCRLP